MISIKSTAVIAVGTSIGYLLVTNPSRVSNTLVKSAIAGTAIVIITVLGAVFGAYKGVEWGEKQARLSPSNGAFEIPFGLVIGEAAGALAGLVVAGTVSTIALTIL